MFCIFLVFHAITFSLLIGLNYELLNNPMPQSFTIRCQYQRFRKGTDFGGLQPRCFRKSHPLNMNDTMPCHKVLLLDVSIRKGAEFGNILSQGGFQKLTVVGHTQKTDTQQSAVYRLRTRKAKHNCSGFFLSRTLTLNCIKGGI